MSPPQRCARFSIKPACELQPPPGFAIIIPMKLIGIISDTHGRFDERIFNQFAEVDAIIHAGDIGSPSILHELEAIAPVYAVLGNNDIPEYGERVSRWAAPVIDGVPFLVAHYPKDVLQPSARQAALNPGDPVPRVLVHGHTHVPRIVTGKDVSPADLMICPGSTFRPHESSPRCVALMQVDGGKVLNVAITDLSGNEVKSYTPPSA